MNRDEFSDQDEYEDEYENHYANEYEENPRRRRKSPSTSTVVIIVLAVIGGGGILVCCGGMGALFYFGAHVVAKEVELELRDNPVLIQHIGEIEDLRMDWTATAAHPDQDVLVFTVRGTKGQGEVIVNTVTQFDENNQVQWATLRLPDGEEIPLIEPE